MTVAIFDSLTRQATAQSINFYQRYLSPHKGFACAHRVLHHGESCSQYVKRVVVERGWGEAVPLIRDRFRACKAAKYELQQRQALAMSQEENDPEPQRKEQNSASGCSSWDTSGCDGTGCDLLECGSLGDGLACADCSGVDCGSWEACSCEGGDCGVGSCSFG